MTSEQIESSISGESVTRAIKRKVDSHNGIYTEYLKLVAEISKVRLYDALGVRKGIMVKDNELVFDLVKRARKLISKENGEKRWISIKE